MDEVCGRGGMKEEFLKFVNENMTVEDVPGDDMKMIARECGIDVAIKVMLKLKGTRFFVPKNWQKKIVRKYILANPGKSVKEFVRDTDMSDWFINDVLNQKAEDERQSTLDDIY